MRDDKPRRLSRLVLPLAAGAGCLLAPFGHRSRLRDCVAGAKTGAEMKATLRGFLEMWVIAGALMLGCSAFLLLLARGRDHPQRTLADQLFVLCLCTSIPGQALGPVGTCATLYANLSAVPSGNAEAFFRVARPAFTFVEALLAYACYTFLTAVLMVYFVLQTDPAQLAVPWAPLDSLWLSVVMVIPWVLALLMLLHLANVVAAATAHGGLLHDSSIADTTPSPTATSEYSLGMAPAKGGNGTGVYAGAVAPYVGVNGHGGQDQRGAVLHHEAIHASRLQAVSPHLQAADLSRESREPGGGMCPSPALSSVSQLTEFRDQYQPDVPIPGGFCRHQRVRTPKLLKVGGAVAVMEGGQGYVVGPSSSTSYVKVRFDLRVDGKSSSIDVLPDQVEPTLWRYCPFNGLACGVRGEPLMNGQRTNFELRPGEIFGTSEIVLGEDGVLFLRLADGRGWVFDKTLDGGALCVPHQDDDAAPAQHAQPTSPVAPQHPADELLHASGAPLEAPPASPPRASPPATWRRETPTGTPHRSAARL